MKFKKKNEIINNLNLNNNRLKHDLLDKDNIIHKKENEILALSQDNKLYKKKYEEFNQINSNNNNKDSIIELRKEMKNLYKENNTLRNQLNDIKLNMIEGNQGQNHIGAKKEFLENNKNDNELEIIKKELELQKKNILLNKKKYENEINSLSKRSEDLSKKLTLKIQEIISLQRENIEIKTLLNEKNNNNTNNINFIQNQLLKQIVNTPKYGTIQNNNNNDIFKLKEENLKLKNIINNNEKEKNNMKNKLVKLNQQNILLKKQIQIKNNQILAIEDNENNNQIIMSLQQELEQLRKMIEENNYKSIEYEQQINKLQNILNDKDKIIKQYKEKLQNMNNINDMNDINQFQNINQTIMNELQNKNKEIENLQKTILNNNQKINELNNIISIDKQKLEELKKSSNETQNDLINKYKREIDELNNAFLKANSIIEEKDLMIKKLKQKPNLNNNNQSLQLKIIELENRNNQLEQENQNLTDEIMKNSSQNNNTSKNINENNNINLLNIKISNLEQENEYYKNKAEELQKQIKNLQKNENKDNTTENKENTLDMIIDNKTNDELELIRKENMNLEYNVNQLNEEITNLNKLNEKLKQDYELEKNKNSELDHKNKELIEKMKKNNNINNKINNNKDDDMENKLKKKQEELEALNTFLFKLQKDLEKSKEDNEEYQSKINTLQKENASIKKQLERLTTSMPKEINALQAQLDEAKKKITILEGNNINNIPKTFSSHSDRNKIKSKDKNKTLDNKEFQSEAYNNLLSKLNESNKENTDLKKRIKELQFQLEEKEVKSVFSGYKTEDVNISNYEEEFDLRKMANGARDKNRSEDINIDYPGIQGIKERMKELEFKFNNLVEQVKILIGNITFNQKIKPQITQICQLLGYSPKTSARILTSKDKKKLLGI